jgi:negative regulator of flagellin synthesis FlgM
MHIYGPSQMHGSQPIGPMHGPRPAQQTTRPEAPQVADEVNISDAARFVEQVQQMPEMREDRVESVRLQIASGTYETNDKLNVALDRLLDEIG